MRRLLLLVIAVLTLAGTARASSWWDNYAPDNKRVRLTSTNLPIVWIEVDGQYIDRDNRITARMKIIHNGDGRLNYADTVAHPGQTIDYEGYVALRYRGSSSFGMSDKKPYSPLCRQEHDARSAGLRTGAPVDGIHAAGPIL